MGEIQDKKKISELCGVIIGDGWIQSNKQGFFLTGDPIEDKEYYDKHISQIISEIIKPVTPKEFPYWKVYGIGIYDRENVKKLIDFDLPIGRKAKTAKIPNWIKKSSKKIKYAFVRGLFDADGNIHCQKDYTKYANEFNSKYHTKSRLRFTSVSKELIDEVFEILTQFKFRCVKRMRKRGFSNNRNNSDIYLLEINSINSVDKFFNEIKPSNQKHVTRYKIWKRFGFCPPHTTINQRKDILKNALDPYKLYTRVCQSGQMGCAQNALA